MNRLLGFFLVTFLLISYSSSAENIALDSTGVVKKAGKTFIVHEVEQGETMYSVSRRYNVKVDELFIENPEAKNGLSIGQKILVPYVEVPKETKVHVVKPSETLFSIARMYNVSSSDLKRWNNLSDNTIGIGDKLFIKGGKKEQETASTTVAADTRGKKTHTVQPSETLYSISRQYGVDIASLRSWNQLSGNEISIGQVLIVSDGSVGNATTQVQSHSSMLPGYEKPDEKKTETEVVVNPVAETKAPEPAPSSPTSSSSLYTVEDDVKTTYENKKIIENGIAEVIEGSTETKKYLALHRTAPIGTIMQVRNEMNNQTVFVRVVGNIPDTGNNKSVLIKISKKAFDRLGSVDSKFPVEVSYIP